MGELQHQVRLGLVEAHRARLPLGGSVLLRSVRWISQSETHGYVEINHAVLNPFFYQSEGLSPVNGQWPPGWCWSLRSGVVLKGGSKEAMTKPFKCSVGTTSVVLCWLLSRLRK